MRRGSLFWGTLLILLGGLFLLNTLGFLTVNIWRIFWPALLVVVGLWVLFNALAGPVRAETRVLRIPLEGAEQARIRLEYGAGRLNVGGGASSGDLVTGTFSGGVDYRSRRTEGGLDVRMDAQGFPFLSWPAEPREWMVSLTNAIPLSLNVEVGAAEATFDLSGLRVTDLKLQTGAASTELTLPARAGYTRVRVQSGAASVSIRVPEGVAARIRAKGGLADINVDSSRFPRTGEDFYQSADYDAAENRVEIEAETGVGSLKIS